MQLPNKWIKLTVNLTLPISLLLAACTAPQRGGTEFDGVRALQDVQAQTALGPRTPGSSAHRAVQDYIRTQLEAAGWQVFAQTDTVMGHPLVNLYARRDARPPEVLLGAHYDTRPVADQDTPQNAATPIPGANDGASGVAVLLELARSLPADGPSVWLIFFDLEDSGNLPGYDWSLGAQSFVQWLSISGYRPRAAVIVDMVGDADLTIYYESQSDAALRQAIWQTAADIGYAKNFIPAVKYTMLDDHLPFLQAGIPAALLIDFDYPYWHTLADSADKVSADSLQAVGKTLQQWLLSLKPDKTVTNSQ